MWKTSVSREHQEALDVGMQVELVVPGGLLLLQRDEEARLHITWIHEDDAQPLRHKP